MASLFLNHLVFLILTIVVNISVELFIKFTIKCKLVAHVSSYVCPCVPTVHMHAYSIYACIQYICMHGELYRCCLGLRCLK